MALVLTQSLHERVIIGKGKDQVIVTVIEVGRGKARIAYDGPRSVPIDRESVRIAKELCHEPQTDD